MSKDEIEKEIENLEAEQKRLEADFHAIRGALIAYRQVLARLNGTALRDEEASTDNK